MRTRTERIMMWGCWWLAVASLAAVVAGIIVGTDPILWVVNAVCGGLVGSMGFIIWDATR